MPIGNHDRISFNDNQLHISFDEYKAILLTAIEFFFFHYVLLKTKKVQSYYV